MPSLCPASITVTYNYCNVQAGAPKATTDKSRRLLNVAARLVSDTKKFDRGLTHLMHVDLHWLDVPLRVKYKLVSMSPVVITWLSRDTISACSLWSMGIRCC